MRQFLCAWCIGALLIGFSTVKAQNCELSISGKVLDAHDKNPLALAEVSIKSINRGTVVDSSGNYNLKGLCPGDYVLTATHVGCEPVFKVIHLTKNMAGVNLYPEHHQEMLAEAEVISAKKRETAQAQAKLNEQELESVQGKTIGDALEQVSGVNSLRTGQSIVKPVIHGLYGNRVVTLNQGVRQEDQQWGMEHGLNIDLFSADDISVVKGVGAVQYGAGAVGGVVRINSAPLPYGDNHVLGKAYLVGKSNGRGGSTALRLEQGLGKNAAYRVQFSAEKSGDLHTPDYILSNTGTQGLNGSFNFGYKFKKLRLELFYSHYSKELAVLRASLNGSLTDFNAAISRNRPFYIFPFTYKINYPSQKLSHDLARVEAHYQVNDKNYLKATYGFQYDQRREYDIRRGGRSDIPANYLKLQTQTLDMVLNSSYSQHWSAKYGYSGMVQANTNIPGTGIRPILPNYNLYNSGLFVTQKYQQNRWIWEIGARYDYDYIFSQKYDHEHHLLKYPFHFNNLAASAGATYSINENWQISSMLAYAFRAPHVNELLSEGLHHGTGTIEQGDTSLSPERSLNWSNTLTVDYPGKVRVELTAYVNPYHNYIYLLPESQPELTVRGTFAVYDYTQNDVLLGGLDLSTDIYFTKNLTYRIRGNYVRGYNLNTNEDLVLIAPTQVSHALHYEINREQKKISNAFVEVGQKLVAQQTHYPAGQDLAPPPAGYQLLNASAGCTWQLPKKQSLDVSLSADNLLNARYRDYLNRFRYFVDQPGFNLDLKVKYQF